MLLSMARHGSTAHAGGWGWLLNQHWSFDVKKINKYGSWTMTPNFPIRAPITKLAFTEPTELPVDLRKLLRVLLSETFGFRSFSL